MREALFHVTVLSNLARAFDKYSLSYSKARIPESTFPDRFFLLRRDELGIGLRKASRLLERLSLAGDQLIVLETREGSEQLQPNERTGLGRFIPRPEICLSAVHGVEADGSLTRWELEVALARSLASPASHADALRGAAASLHLFPAHRAGVPGRLCLLLLRGVDLGGADARRAVSGGGGGSAGAGARPGRGACRHHRGWRAGAPAAARG